MVIFILLAFSFLLTTITTLPFILILLLCLAVVFKTSWVFVLAFFTGLFLDLSQVGVLGQSSIFFIIFIFLLFLYERKFEIQTLPFVFFAAFLGSLSYLLVFGYDHVFTQALVSGIVAILLFKLLARRFLYST